MTALSSWLRASVKVHIPICMLAAISNQKSLRQNESPLMDAIGAVRVRQSIRFAPRTCQTKH